MVWNYFQKPWSSFDFTLERAQQTTIFRLRTGHCGLSAHLKTIGISDTSLCECGQADQTPDHVLQSCPNYAERRQLTWPQGADLATKLWSSAKDLYRRLVLWHQPDWRSNMHGCRSLKKKKNLRSLSHEAAQKFAMVNYLKELTKKKFKRKT